MQQQQRTDWRLQGDWIKNCNCAFGCPCDFNARPTQGRCLGLLGMRIERGHFGDVRLDGLSFFVTVDFPGAVHEGNGTIQPIIDERAAPEQRDAAHLVELRLGAVDSEERRHLEAAAHDVLGG